LTAHSVTLNGLAASTAYQFRVRSIDAGGNTAVSANFSFTTTGQSGGAIPPTLGWYQIPNTKLRPLCPSYSEIQGATRCDAVMSAWSGGLFDTNRNRFVMWGGGHTDYFGNEIYAVNLNTNPITVTLVKDASHGSAVSNVNSCPDTYNDGTMSSRHTYSGLVYIPTTDRYWEFGGAVPGPCGNFSSNTWSFNPTTLAWTQDNAGGGPNSGANGSLPSAAYDSVNNAIYMVENNVPNFWRYNVAPKTWTNLGGVSIVCQSSNITAVIDPVRRLYFCIGGGAFSKVSLNSPSTASNLTASGCSTLKNTPAPGFAYDPVQQRMVGWAGGNTVYIYNPDTDSCTTQTFSGGPTTIQGNGTYGRFQYSPASGVFIVANDVDSNAYALRLTRASEGSS
jgi:hypothetical protein